VATQDTNLHLGLEARALARPSASRRSPLLWLSLVCLDAPLVAVTWQALFGRAFHLPVPVAARVVLFLTTWCIYLGDRLADVTTLTRGQACSLRQRYCQRHFAVWRAALITLVLLDLACILTWLDLQMMLVGVLVGAVVLLYLFANHFAHHNWRTLPLKEALVGTLFAIGSVAVFWSSSARPSVLWSMLLLAAACTLNCVHIAAWERALDTLQGKTSLATRFPSTGLVLPTASCLLVLTCALSFALGIAPASLCTLLGLSALLLGALHVFGARLPVDERTALADLTLAIPLVFCFVGSS
jgi:hypothetical protein